MKLAILLLLSTGAVFGNTCAAWNQAAQTDAHGAPLFPAIVNGLDGVTTGGAGILPDAYSVRVVWSADVLSSQQRVKYATAAEWASNPGVYPHQFSGSSETISNVAWPQAISFSGLTASTSYHFQPQSFDGSTWCTNLDLVATTAAAPGIVYPVPPATVTNTSSAGLTFIRTRTVGVSTGCTGANNAAALQACIGSQQPGDKIIIQHNVLYGTGGSFQFPDNPLAKPFTANLAPNYFTCAGCTSWSNWASGPYVAVGAYYPLPTGLSNSYIYKVINVGSNGPGTFNLSEDGVNALAVSDVGVGQLLIARYPDDLTDTTGNPITVVTTDGLLPPDGVRLDSSYDSQLAIIQKQGTPGQALNNCGSAPPDTCAVIELGVLSSNIHFLGIKSTTNDITVAGETVPNYFNVGITGGLLRVKQYNYGIVFDRVRVTSAPSPNSIDTAVSHGGPNGAFINSIIDPSYVSNIGRFLPASSASSNTLTLNGAAGQAGAYSYPGTGGVPAVCYVATAKTLTITGSGNFIVYLDPANSCNLVAQLQTGMSATGAGFTVTTAATPTFPVSANGRYTVLPVGSGSVSGGVVSFADYFQGEAGGIPLLFTGNQGPILIENNSIKWRDIGLFADVDGQAKCGSGCQPLSGGVKDATIRRNTVQFDRHYYAKDASWTGWGSISHTGPIETKGCWRCLVTGNVFDVIPSNFSIGMCIEHTNLNVTWPSAYPNQSWNRDVEDKFNTCINGNLGFYFSGNYGLNSYGAETYSPVNKTFWVHDNLIVSNWFYSEYSPQASATYSQPGGGSFVNNSAVNQNMLFEHNTDLARAGNTGSWLNFSIPAGAITARNNLMTYLGQIHFINSGGGGLECGGTTEINVVTCPANADWSVTSNYALPTYGTNGGDPTALIELQPGSAAGQIGAYQALWPGNTVNMIAGSTTPLSSRTAAVAWYNPTTPGNFYAPFTSDTRLKWSSPYVSGNHLATDGLNIGADIEALNSEQGAVQNVHSYSSTATSTNIAFVAPDSFGCAVDWSTAAFNGSNTWTRVSNAGGKRPQTVALSGLPSHGLVYVRVNCATVQPTLTVQLP